jgi:hypothetical protein
MWVEFKDQCAAREFQPREGEVFQGRQVQDVRVYEWRKMKMYSRTISIGCQDLFCLCPGRKSLLQLLPAPGLLLLLRGQDLRNRSSVNPCIVARKGCNISLVIKQARALGTLQRRQRRPLRHFSLYNCCTLVSNYGVLGSSTKLNLYFAASGTSAGSSTWLLWIKP